MDNMDYLLETTDAMVWAKAWCEVAREIAEIDGSTAVAVFDEGVMVGWFSNAIEVGYREGLAAAEDGVRSC